MKRVGWIAFFAMLMVLSAGIGQVAQVMASSTELREDALAEWAGEDDDRQAHVTAFVAQCLSAGKTDKPPIIEPPVSYQECAENNGFGDLVPVIASANSKLQKAAWPLSLLE